MNGSGRIGGRRDRRTDLVALPVPRLVQRHQLHSLAAQRRHQPLLDRDDGGKRPPRHRHALDAAGRIEMDMVERVDDVFTDPEREHGDDIGAVPQEQLGLEPIYDAQQSGENTWEFEKGSRVLKVRVEGPLVVKTGSMALKAVLGGLGLAYLPEDRVRADLDGGRLVRVLSDWCSPFPGNHLHYPSRRQPTSAFALVVETLPYRG
jgi:DNA-binding transcriptional LysR family regulator